MQIYSLTLQTLLVYTTLKCVLLATFFCFLFSFFLVASQQWVIQLVLMWAFQICLHGSTVKIRDSKVSNKENWKLIDSFCGKAGTQLPWMPYTNLSTGSAARRHTSGRPVQAKLW